MPNCGIIHDDALYNRTTMTDHAIGTDEASGHDFSIAAHNRVASDDRWSADYRLALHDGA
jgi:hypothetical protein